MAGDELSAAQPPSAVPQPASPAPRPPRTGIIVLAAAAIVAVLGGGAFLAYKGVIPLPFLAPKPPSLAETLQALGTIRSSRVTTDLHVSVAPREPGVGPVPLIGPETAKKGEATGFDSRAASTSILKALPADAAASMTVTTDWAAGAARPEAETSVSGSYAAGGLTVQFDLAWLAANGASYLKIDKMPALIVDFSTIAGTWVKMPAQTPDIGSALLSGGGQDEQVSVFATKTQEPAPKPEPVPVAAKADPVDEAKALLAAVLKNGALSLASIDPNAVIAGKPAWKLNVALDLPKFRQAYQDVYARRKELFPGKDTFTLFSDANAAGFTDESVARAEKAVAHMSLAVYVDKKTRQPVSFELRIPVAPDESDAPKLKDKEIVVTCAVTLDRINDPVAVVEPKDAITFKQAMNRMLGRSEAQMKVEDQGTIVSDLREALDAYKEKNDGYPDGLGQLVGLEVNPFAGFSGEDTTIPAKVVARIPDDVFTGKPFVYRKTADGYELEYQMKEPGGDALLSASGYVAGTNTATQDTVSREADRASESAAQGSTQPVEPPAAGDGTTP